MKRSKRTVRHAVTAAIESMEARRLLDAVPTADIRVSDVTSAGPELHVTVHYAAEAKVSAQSIDATDLAVKKDGDTGAALVARAVVLNDAADANLLVATYVIDAPGGSWDPAENGTWQVTLIDGAVTDAAGAVVPSRSAAFKVEVPAPLPPPVVSPPPPVEPPPVVSPPPPVEPPPVVTPPPPPPPKDDDDDDDRSRPEAKIEIQDIPSAGATSLSVLVTYEDDAGIDPGTIGSNDIEITDGNGKSLKVTVVGTHMKKGGREALTTYTAEAPNGAWAHTDNGTWKVKVLDGAVRDTSGLDVEGESKTFKVEIDPPPAPVPPPPPVETPTEPTPEPTPANEPPNVSIAPLADIVSASDSAYTVTITYRDADGIAFDSIGPRDLLVTGPGGVLAVANVQIDGSPEVRTVTYTLATPGGSWDAADSGRYDVSVVEGAVRDRASNASAAVATAFNVTIVPIAPVIDTGFSGGAPVRSGFVAEAAVTLEDGRIILAGRQGDIANGTSRGVLKRLNADGSIDDTFGNAGAVVTNPDSNIAFYGLAVLPDGSLLAAGHADGDVLVQRYKANGAVDSQFGLGGTSTINWGAADDTAYGVAITADGRIVVGGGSNGSFGFARLTAGGSVDTFFGTLGSSLFALGTGGANIIGGVAVQADGKIVGVGAVDGQVAVLQLQENGDADTSFGTGGAIIISGLSTRTDLGTTDYTLGLAVQGDGRIVIANQSGTDFAVTRLTPAGVVDATFASGGRATIDFGGDDDADAIVVQNSGDILVVGTTTVDGSRIAVAALHNDGTINTQFGDNGRLTLESGLSDPSRALHVGNLVLRAFASARGNQVLVGGSEGGTNAVSSSGLRRLNVPGSGLLGRFGAVDGKNKKLRFVDNDSTVITLNLKGGSGQAYYDGSNVDIVLSGVSESSRLKINAVGGDGRLSLRNVRANGSLRNVLAQTADLTGTFWVGGSVTKLALGTISGTVAASGSIGTLQVGGNAERVTVLAGANLGSDYQLGGTGTASDVFSSATIRNINVRGEVVGSLFAAGLNRGNQIFLDGDDAIEGGDASRIDYIRVGKGIDASTRFVAGYVGTVKTSTPIDLAEDDRFVVL